MQGGSIIEGDIMAEELKGLIEKIQVEGIQAAEEKAKSILDEAKRKAAALVERANSEAQKLIQEANERIAKTEESSRVALKQAGRDTMISLRSQINSLLDKIIRSSIQEALSPSELGRIIAGLIKELKPKHAEGIEITLSKDDIERIEKGFLSELKEEAKKGVVLKPQDEISAGFLISFDSGKSHFDFTDKALADYLASYLKPKLQEILK